VFCVRFHLCDSPLVLTSVLLCLLTPFPDSSTTFRVTCLLGTHPPPLNLSTFSEARYMVVCLRNGLQQYYSLMIKFHMSFISSSVRYFELEEMSVILTVCVNALYPLRFASFMCVVTFYLHLDCVR
jgi:hypothetical protein